MHTNLSLKQNETTISVVPTALLIQIDPLPGNELPGYCRTSLTGLKKAEMQLGRRPGGHTRQAKEWQ